ncbi:hypothetical protein PSYMO_37981, partial [Pseudomonas amygdali pv. mori str. 301020]
EPQICAPKGVLARWQQLRKSQNNLPIQGGPGEVW